MPTRRILVVSLAACSALVIACGGGCGPRQPASTAEETEPVAKREVASEARQERRQKVIRELIDRGIFKSVEYGERPTVYVTDAFRALDFDDKQSFVTVVAAYAFKLPDKGYLAEGELVFIIDSKTGSGVGVLGRLGLLLD
jgi:hypothetical protein